jgi:hypothetical protein
MSDTPETDASRGYALSSHYGRIEGSYLQMDRSGPFVHAEVARKLERERNEALMDRDDGDIATMTRNYYERILKERDEAIRQRNETNESSKYAVDYAIRERDEAIRQLENLKAAAIHTCHDQCQRPMCVLRRERDEAREKIKRQAERIRQLEGATNHAGGTPLSIALRERDEARELLRILAGLVAYGLGQSGEEWSLEAMRQATAAIQNAKFLEAAK